MSEGRRERATQWFNFRFLLTKANSAGNYSSVVPNLGSFSFSCLKTRLQFITFELQRFQVSLFCFRGNIVFWLPRSLSDQTTVKRLTKHNGLLWISPRCYVLLCTNSTTDNIFHIRGIDLSQELIKHLKKPFFIKNRTNLVFLLPFLPPIKCFKTKAVQVVVSNRKHGMATHDGAAVNYWITESCHIPRHVTYANYEGTTKASRLEGEGRGSTCVTFQHSNQYDQGFPQWPDPGWCYAPEVAFPFIATDQLSQHTINHGTEYKYNTNTNTIQTQT